jgi:5-formyltetrahydrofolate cyclo-ligase
MTDKDTLRQQALARRRGLKPEERASASGLIQQRLLEYLSQATESDIKLQSAPLLIYRSLSDEVDTTGLFESWAEQGGRDVYAPVTHEAGHMQWHRIDARTRWQRGNFGILEPSSGALWSAKENPAVLAGPLVGFDRNGNRLGLGKGCFDRWLAGVKNHILLRIGLAFACQECPAIPSEEHDIPLDIIITEGEIITCRNC